MFQRQISRQLPSGLSRPPIGARPHPPSLHCFPSLGRPLGPLVPRRTFVESIVTQTQEIITAFHHITGTPWYLTIALVALGVNTTRIPFFIYSRRIQQRRVELTPLMYAWHARIAKLTPPAPGKTTAQLVAEVNKKVARVQKKLYRTFGLQQWRLNGTLLTLPIWLGIMESLRRLCGGPTGLLGTLFFDKGSINTAAANSGSATDAMSVATAPTATTAAGALADVAAPVASTLEPSLATGGLLWFPDLLVPDPYHVLPWVLSLTLAANIGLVPTSLAAARQLLVGDNAAKEGDSGGSATTQSTLRTGLRRTLLILSIAIAPVTMNFPAALHLYWICSSGTSMLLTGLIRKRMPLPKPIASRCEGQNRVMLLPRPEKDEGQRGVVFK